MYQYGSKIIKVMHSITSNQQLLIVFHCPSRSVCVDDCPLMNLSNLTRCSRDFIPSSRSSRASSHSINSSPLICSSLKESLYCARPIRWSSFRIYRTQTWQRQCALQCCSFSFVIKLKAQQDWKYGALKHVHAIKALLQLNQVQQHVTC